MVFEGDEPSAFAVSYVTIIIYGATIDAFLVEF
jgi:hypothetical protein